MSFFFLLQWLELVWKFPSTVAFRVGWPMDKTSVIQSLMIELLAWHTRNLVSNPCFAWSRADFFFFCSKPLLCFNLSDLNLGLHVPNAIPQPSGYGIFVLKWKHFYLNLSFADKETYEIYLFDEGQFLDEMNFLRTEPFSSWYSGHVLYPV